MAKFETTEQAKDHALSLRRAMEGLNALASCAGFDPEANPAFWRCEMEKMATWIGPADLKRLSRDLLSHFEVISSFDEEEAPSAQVLALGFAACVSMDPASPAMAVHREVLAQLHKHLLTDPPLLEIMLGPEINYMDDTSWRLYFDTIRQLPTAFSMMSDSIDVETAKIAIGRESDTRLSLVDTVFATDALVEILEQKSVDLKEIHGACDCCQIQEWEAETPQTRRRPTFSDVMKELHGADSVASMSWQFDSFCAMNAAILFSAVASMRELKSLMLIEDVGSESTIATRRWLAFALRRRQLQGLELALSVEFEDEGAEAFVLAMREEETFACLIPSTLCETTEIDYFRLGTSAKTTDGAALTQELLMDPMYQRSGRCNGARVDILAKCGSRCVVVVPASGLMWVKTHTLNSWDYPVEQIALPMPPSLTTLIFYNCDLSDVKSVSQAVEAQRYGLELFSSERSVVETLYDYDWELLPECCSMLQTLTISDYEVPTLELVLQAPGIKTFAARYDDAGAPMSLPSPFFDAIVSPRGHGLRELSLQSLTLSRECLEALAASLVNHHHLRFVQFQTNATLGTWPRLREQFAIVLGPTDRSLKWIDAFLWCVRSSEQWHSLPRLCQQRVVEFAVIHARRQVELSNA